MPTGHEGELAGELDEAATVVDQRGLSVGDLADAMRTGASTPTAGKINAYPAPIKGPCRSLLLLVLPQAETRQYHDGALDALRTWLACADPQRLVIMTDTTSVPRLHRIVDELVRSGKAIAIDVWIRVAAGAPRAVVLSRASPTSLAEMLP